MNSALQVHGNPISEISYGFNTVSINNIDLEWKDCIYIENKN